jgi:hypothetical protein
VDRSSNTSHGIQRKRAAFAASIISGVGSWEEVETFGETETFAGTWPREAREDLGRHLPMMSQSYELASAHLTF